MDRAPFVLTQAEIKRRQRLRCEHNIKQAALEARIYLAALVEHPADITLELCDDIRACMGRIEAAGQLLHGAPADDEQLNAHARADERDERNLRREP